MPDRMRGRVEQRIGSFQYASVSDYVRRTVHFLVSRMHRPPGEQARAQNGAAGGD